MRIKRAATLVCTFEGVKPVVHNFLKKEMFECTAHILDILARLDDWQTMEGALARLPGPLEATTELLKDLISRDLLLLEGSPEAERDRKYRDHWRWGAVAGFYHFSLRDSKFIGGEATLQRARDFGGPTTSPPLLTLNASLKEVVSLPDFDRDDAFFGTLFKRRSCREYTGKPIALRALADCLYAAKGIKEIIDTGPFGRLPMSMTPSGGARNPFELYVDIRAVNDLKPGIYHYSGFEHTLGFIHDDERETPARLLGGQAWANTCSAIIFLAANFDRPGWKYRQALAYRVVLMEVGAIVQNIQLAATHHDIAAAPTGALAESLIETQLGLEPVRQAALFAITLGDPQYFHNNTDEQMESQTQHAFLALDSGVCDMLREDLPEQLTMVADALARNAPIEAASHVHTIHGSAAFCKLPSLTNISAELEDALKNNKQHTELFVAFQHHINEVLRILDTID